MCWLVRLASQPPFFIQPLVLRPALHVCLPIPVGRFLKCIIKIPPPAPNSMRSFWFTLQATVPSFWHVSLMGDRLNEETTTTTHSVLYYWRRFACPMWCDYCYAALQTRTLRLWGNPHKVMTFSADTQSWVLWLQMPHMLLPVTQVPPQKPPHPVHKPWLTSPGDSAHQSPGSRLRILSKGVFQTAQRLSRRQEAGKQSETDLRPQQKHPQFPWMDLVRFWSSLSETPLYVFSQNDEKDVWTLNRRQRMVL